MYDNINDDVNFFPFSFPVIDSCRENKQGYMCLIAYIKTFKPSEY